ncbi:MAG TPA: adenine phosphoribosyltransferase [Burkholderiales bacterium]|nr:adenine phosphoribosyltransferase [Burkholderiales bacterium]
MSPIFPSPAFSSGTSHRSSRHPRRFARRCGGSRTISAGGISTPSWPREARGFIFGAPLALELAAAFVPVRKPGKLPFQRHTYQYELEYGTDALEMHVDGVRSGQRVLLIDDLLATGGTARACCNLLQKMGAKMEACAFVIELAALNGRRVLAPCEVYSLITY